MHKLFKISCVENENNVLICGHCKQDHETGSKCPKRLLIQKKKSSRITGHMLKCPEKLVIKCQLRIHQNTYINRSTQILEKENYLKHQQTTVYEKV